MAAKLAVGDLKAAPARIGHFRGLFERLFEAEAKLDSTFSEWDRQPLIDQIRSIRREMTRLADDVHKDLARRGTEAAMLYLRDAPILGGRVYLVPLVQALIDGSARAYNVTPDTVDVQFEAAIAWYEKQLESASHNVPQAVSRLEGIELKAQPERSMRAVDQREAPVSLGLLHTSASLVGLITGAVAVGGWI